LRHAADSTREMLTVKGEKLELRDPAGTIGLLIV
jgi:hypothetical protein